MTSKLLANNRCRKSALLTRYGFLEIQLPTGNVKDPFSNLLFFSLASDLPPSAALYLHFTGIFFTVPTSYTNSLIVINGSKQVHRFGPLFGASHRIPKPENRQISNDNNNTNTGTEH